MYTIKKINGAEVLHNNNEPATCPYAMAAVPFQSTLGQMQVVPINRECSSRCAQFAMNELEDQTLYTWCTGRSIKLENNIPNFSKTL